MPSMYAVAISAALAGLLPAVAGHGLITSPTPRTPGDAMSAACGEQVYNNQKSDSYGNVQGELQVAANQNDYKADECNIWLCKGYKFADSAPAALQTFSAGQSVPIVVDIRAPHTGSANVSVVSTKTGAVIGQPLKTWDVYASVESEIPASDKSFSVTIPDGLESQCATAGDCVVQWWWNAASIDQTYESCIDFVIGSGGSKKKRHPRDLTMA